MKYKDNILSFGLFVLAIYGVVTLFVGGYHSNVNAPAHDFREEVLGAAMFTAALFIQAIRRR